MRDLVDLQSSFAKKSFDSAVAESTKVSEISVKVANEAFQPISAQINATIGKLTSRWPPDRSRRSVGAVNAAPLEFSIGTRPGGH